jgi:hypothetical protein
MMSVGRHKKIIKSGQVTSFEMDDGGKYNYNVSESCGGKKLINYTPIRSHFVLRNLNPPTFSFSSLYTRESLSLSRGN